jgi:hypothetical protein
MFVSMLRQWAAFSGLGLITHCVMDNHFHVMLWVPARMDLDHEGILERLQGVWPDGKVEAWEEEWQSHEEDTRRTMEAGILERMANLPEFMRVLKRTFSRWYNMKHERTGTLWDCRYRSVVVEGSPLALMSVAAYIDLNPLRAGMVEDPVAYAWSGYGAAMGGDVAARKGLETLVLLSRGQVPHAALMVRKEQVAKEVGSWREIGPRLAKEHAKRAKPESWKEVQAAYRLWLVNKGESKADLRRVKKKVQERKGLDPVEVLAEYERQGVIPVALGLKCRLRTMSRGVAVGSPDFLEGLMGQFRSCFGPKRKTAARKVKGVGDEWMSLRQVNG